MKNFLKTLFMINEPIGRLEFFFISLAASFIVFILWYVSVYLLYYIDAFKADAPLLFMLGEFTLLAFVLLFGLALLVINFVCITKRCWDIIPDKLLSVIIGIILMVLNFLIHNIVINIICYLILCLLPGQIFKRQNDISVLDILKKEDEHSSEEG